MFKMLKGLVEPGRTGHERMSESAKKSRKRDPLTVEMTVVVKAGPEPEDRYTVMENRRIPMVGSVFEYRARIQRFMIGTLMRVAARSPSVAREIAPGLAALLGRARPGGKRDNAD